MATGWVKSLQCKSNALEDVYPPTPSKKPLLPLSCANSSHAFKDVVFLLPKHPSSLPKKPSPKPTPPPQTKPRPRTRPKPKHRPAPPSPSAPGPAHSHQFPTLAELPAGHSSRRVVEIIFSSSWSSRGAAFPGEIEMLFRVHNPPRTVARFEEYRTAVRARCAASHSDDARCAADGNEMMRFHCAPSSSASSDAIYDGGEACSEVWSPGGKAGGVRTFAGSGRAHGSAGGGAGRRAMLVCRVIAGRVRTGSDPESAGESVSLPKGELVVFDPRAVLPCFLIIYRV
ncbi:hypothetical protein COCNU_10G004120 [Cocos nucifera]|uniref:Uncharacterized protein n=1 Tax=Cocos nucifera TaxID=13894 RepID=A0A8K0IN74_COCNU|nr:hypothetical protein COCNU_10G004120 [Cocos nucifera]